MFQNFGIKAVAVIVFVAFLMASMALPMMTASAQGPEEAIPWDPDNIQVGMTVPEGSYFRLYCPDCDQTALNIAEESIVDTIEWFEYRDGVVALISTLPYALTFWYVPVTTYEGGECPGVAVVTIQPFEVVLNQGMLSPLADAASEAFSSGEYEISSCVVNEGVAYVYLDPTEGSTFGWANVSQLPIQQVEVVSQ